jgi:neutral ceramidase
VAALLLGLVLALGAGCAALVVRPPVLAAPPEATGTWRAGAATADLTPMPGFPMGGYSVAGQTARGHWTRLRARAIYLEDPAGHRMALVACDLWSMPGGLADRVAELLAEDPRGRTPRGLLLARGQLLLAATHTHQSPGNFSSASAYNTFASPRVGFDRGLFEFLAHQIRDAILNAAGTARPAVVRYAEGPVEGLARNRSFGPFLQNAEEAEALLAANAGLPEQAVPGEYSTPPPPYPPGAIYRAVRPRLAVLSIHEAAHPAIAIAAAAFVAAHPTSIGPRTALYGGDFFAVAAIVAEHTLRKRAPAPSAPVVAIFNGAEGDVSPSWQCRDPQRPDTCQTRRDALALGRILAARIADLSGQGEVVSGAIEHRFAPDVKLVGQCVPGQPSICTAPEPMIGAPMVGGTPDARTDAHRLGWREGVTGRPTPDQGPKRPAFDSEFVSADSFVGISRFIMDVLSTPGRVPLGLYAVGSVLLATLPGELTTVMGLRVERALAAAMAAQGRPVRHVILVGLANEYVSYVATPQEYALQYYEGASTLYGPASGPLLLDRLVALTGQFSAAPPPAEATISYAPGPRVGFGLGDVRPEAASSPGLEGMLQDDAGDPLPGAPTFCWSDDRPAFPSPDQPGSRMTPGVSIEVRRAGGAWEPLHTDEAGEESDRGINFITTASPVFPARSRWCVTWLGAVPAADLEARFHVITLGGGSLRAPIPGGAVQRDP